MKLWRRGYGSGVAFDLDDNEADNFDSHPDVMALNELQRFGYVELHLDELMRAGWTIAADLTPKGISFAEAQAFSDDVPSERFTFP